MIALKNCLPNRCGDLEFYGPKKPEVIEMMKELIQLQGIQSVIQLLHILEILAGSKEYHYISSKAMTILLTEHETDRLNKVYEYAFKNFRQKSLAGRTWRNYCI